MNQRKLFKNYVIEKRAAIFSHMTAIPIVPESPRRPLRIAVALMLVMMAVLLAAGCASGDCPLVLYSATITKLDSNGTVEWTKVLDTGMSNSIAGLVPTSDGGFVAAGSLSTGIQSHCYLNSLARIIRFSRSGEILWDHNISETDGTLEIIPMHDGGFALLTGDSKIFRLDSEGKTLWNRITGSSSLYLRSMINTLDGGLIIAGPMFVKFDSDGKVLWQHSYENETTYDIFFITNKKEGSGFVGYRISKKEPRVDFINFDDAGNITNTTEIFSDGHLLGRTIDVGPNGYRLLYTDENQGTTMMQLDPEGKIVATQKIDGSDIFTFTKDQGFLYTESKNVLLEPRQLNPDGTVNVKAPMHWGLQIQVIKLNPDGSLSWNITLPNTNPRNLRAVQTIQTTDGGYVVVSENGVLKDLSMLN